MSYGGLTCAGWLRVYGLCHSSGFSGPELRAWPDGRSLVEQPWLVVETFEVIAGQMVAEAESRRKSDV